MADEFRVPGLEFQVGMLAVGIGFFFGFRISNFGLVLT